MRRFVLRGCGLAVLCGVPLVTGCGGGSPTGAGKPPPSAEKEIKAGKGRVATDDVPPPPVTR